MVIFMLLIIGLQERKELLFQEKENQTLSKKVKKEYSQQKLNETFTNKDTLFFIFIFLSFCLFQGHSPRHMEVPRLGVKLELQPLAYARATAMWDPGHVCNLHHSSQQHQILNPVSKGRDRTCNLMVPQLDSLTTVP